MGKNNYSLRKTLLELDRFGHPVSVNYKGEKEFKTLVGSIVTLMIYIVIFINSIAIFGEYWNSEN